MPERISSPGLLVTAEPKRRVLLGEPPDRGRDLLLVALRLRRDREAHHRLRESEVRSLDRDLLVGEEIAGLRVLQLGDGAEVALAEVERWVVLLPLHFEQRAHALLALRAEVDERRVRRDRALEHAEEVDAACERVGDRLEDEGGRAGAVDVDRRALLRGGRDAFDEKVEERVRAEVLRRDAACDGEDVAARDRRLERRGDLVRVELLPVEVALHERLVGLDDGVEELLAVLGGEAGQLVRDRAGLALLVALGARVRTHVEHVDDPGELVLGADRDVHRNALRGELVAKSLERAEEVGALAVEHVHEDDARKAELVGKPPGARGADLDAHHGRDRHERAFDHPRGAAELALERRVAGDVDEVDLPVLPLGVLERHRDRELALVLVLVGVGDGRAGRDGAEPIDLARSGRGAPRRATSFPSRGDRRRRRCGSLRARAWAGSPSRRLRFPAEKLSQRPTSL